MARRWKDRSTTPGDRNWKAGSLGFAPDPANVLTTDDIGDGTPGTYVEPVAAEIWDAASGGTAYGASGGFGTYDMLSDLAVSYADGGAAQLAADVLAVADELGNMTTAVVNLLDAANDGTLDLGLYTLTSGIVWPVEANVLTTETAWGPTGAEYAGAYVPGAEEAVWPVEANVSTVETAWGPTGAEYAGTLDTTALEEAAAAAQLVTDTAIVVGNAVYILASTNFGVMGIIGSLATLPSGDLWDMLASDLQLAFADGAATTTYTPADGSTATTPQVLVGGVGTRRVLDGFHEADVMAATVTVRRADVDEPAVGDQVTIDGETFAVAEIIEQTAYQTVLSCHQLEHLSAGDPNRQAETPG